MPQTSVTSVLSLPERDSGGIKSLNSEVKCLFCEKVFAVPNEQETFVVHLLEKHQFMVDKPRSITDFASYINYWRHKFENAPISDVCSILTSKVKQKGEPEKDVDFFMLSDLLQEDRELRIQLQQRRLEDVLEFHRKERQDASFKRDCLFCRTTYEGDYAAYLNHLAFDHNFSVGKPDNIVFVEDLLNVLEKKLEDLECVYCEKQFKNRDALKEHMRKKGHKKINPKNSSYDKFYVVNYQELDRNWEDISKEKDERGNFSDNDDDLPTGFESESDEDSAQDDRRWGDWVGQHSGAVCLFCPASYTEVPELLSHMTSIHDFDFKDIRNTLKLTFYQQVKVINYVRRQKFLKSCIHCQERFENEEELLKHMEDKGHMKLPSKVTWDQADYFFPTYENDELLNRLDDDLYGKDNDDTVPVPIPEDLNVKVEESVLNDQELVESMGCRKLPFKKQTGKFS